MRQLWPTAGRLFEDFEAADRCGLEEFIQPVLRQGDVDVLRHAADVAVSPNGPTAADYRLAIAGAQRLIERADYASVAPRQVLRLEHGVPPGQQLIGQFKLLR